MSLAYLDTKAASGAASKETPKRLPRPAETVRLFGLEFLRRPYRDASAELLDGPCRTAAYVNPHCINVAARDSRYAADLRTADILLPDGSGFALAAAMAGTHFEPRIVAVTDVFVALLEGAAERGLSVYLLGSADGVAREAAAHLQAAIPNLRIAGTANGFFEDDAAAVADINASGADILLVAMGVPRQERWIAENRAGIDAELTVGVGAFLDFWSGRVPRAPKAFRRVGMEWVHRLCLEPRRMFTRYVFGNPAFMLRAARNAARRQRPSPR